MDVTQTDRTQLPGPPAASQAAWRLCRPGPGALLAPPCLRGARLTRATQARGPHGDAGVSEFLVL